MTSKIIVTGTDTDIGKSVVSAMLVQALSADYYKPVQAGLDGETDTEFVKRLSGMPNEHFWPETYRLQTPASPHLSAKLDGVTIEVNHLELPHSNRLLIVEGAGGLLVPLTDDVLFIEMFARWQAPIVLCASTRLGTINHSLLSIEALRRRNIEILGVVFVGDKMESSETAIVNFGQVKHLGRLPILDPLDSNSLANAFDLHFNIDDFQL